jgi:hypothetical protein
MPGKLSTTEIRIIMTDKFQDKSQVIEAELTPQDEEFLREINEEILEFLEKDEEILEFDPMNSYQRRLVHQMGTLYQLSSKSVGSRDDRYVCLLKSQPLGEILAAVEEPKPAPGPTPSKGVTIDRGNEIFYCRPGQKILLRTDGSFGVPTSDNTMRVVDEREIDSGMFRIQRNHLICPQDEQW